MQRVSRYVSSARTVMLVGLVSLSQACAQERMQTNRDDVRADAKDDSALARVHYPVGETHRTLTLRKLELPPLTQVQLLAYLREHPEANSFPNLAFLLSDASRGDVSGGHVAWIAYAYDNRFVRPRQVWSADVVWNDDENVAYVVVGKSGVLHVTLSVFRVKTDTRVGPYPLILEPREYKDWPQGTEPISSYRSTMRGERPCTISCGSISLENNRLWVRGTCKEEKCRAYSYRFDLKTQKWRDLGEEPCKGDRATSLPETEEEE